MIPSILAWETGRMSGATITAKGKTTRRACLEDNNNNSHVEGLFYVLFLRLFLTETKL